MAKNWIKCAKQGHIPQPGWQDTPQVRPSDQRLFITHICDSCGVLYVRLLPAEISSSLVGSQGEALVKEAE